MQVSLIFGFSLNQETSGLKVHEWLAVATIIVTIFCLIAITSIAKTQTNGIPAFRNEGIEVLIKGAVDNPGIYRFNSEMTMHDILEIAKVQPEADLRRLSLDKPVNKSRSINIPMRAMITVQLKGAVKTPGNLRVPKGTKMEDLLNLVVFDEGANTQKLQKKRALKDNEIIDVTFQ